MGPNMEALHVALKSASINLQGRHVHAYRLCNRHVVHEWAAVLARDVQEWLAEFLDVPLHMPHAHSVLHATVQQGAGFSASRLCGGGRGSQQCCYTPLSTGRHCNRILGANTEHAFLRPRPWIAWT